MVSIDETFDRLKSLRTSPVSTGPDNHLLNEATLLREHFREAQRLPDSKKRGAQFMKELTTAETAATAFETALTSSSEPTVVERAFKSLANSCVACHKIHRDPPDAASPLPR